MIRWYDISDLSSHATSRMIKWSERALKKLIYFLSPTCLKGLMDSLGRLISSLPGSNRRMENAWLLPHERYFTSPLTFDLIRCWILVLDVPVCKSIRHRSLVRELRRERSVRVHDAVGCLIETTSLHTWSTYAPYSGGFIGTTRRLKEVEREKERASSQRNYIWRTNILRLSLSIKHARTRFPVLAVHRGNR